jgi:hypothetical protein
MAETHRPKGGKNEHYNRNPFNRADVAMVEALRATHRWRKVSTIMRATFPICQHPDCHDIANSVHHIKPAINFPDLFFTQTNLIPLCNYHHALVSRLENDGKKQEAIDLYEEHWKQIINEHNKNKYGEL